MGGCPTCLIFRLSAFGLQWFSSRVHASSSLLYPFRIGQFLAAPLVTLRGQLNKCYLNLKSKCIHFFPFLRKNLWELWRLFIFHMPHNTHTLQCYKHQLRYSSKRRNVGGRLARPMLIEVN